MSTVGNVQAGDLAPCWHCRGRVEIHDMCAVRCPRCGVRGPIMNSALEAAQAWNAVRLFGRVGIVHGKAGIPNHTTSLAEALRLASENMAAGVYEDPNGYALLLRFPSRSRAHVVVHGVTLTEVADMAKQVASSAVAQVSLARASGSTSK